MIIGVVGVVMSLDSESEQMIQDGLKQLRTGRTTFVIAHRLSTIRSADQILVMEGGEIVERGTHDELLARDGRYRQLYPPTPLCGEHLLQLSWSHLLGWTGLELERSAFRNFSMACGFWANALI